METKDNTAIKKIDGGKKPQARTAINRLNENV
jgi:hypothetical protein